MSRKAGMSSVGRKYLARGRTIVHLQPNQERPHTCLEAGKKTGGGFLNPAMAPARTRSVIR